MGVIYLIRHGQASFGKADYDQLSELGEEQSHILGRFLASSIGKADTAVAGGLRRHHQTAAACLKLLPDAPEVLTHEGWNEFDSDSLIVNFAPRYADKAVLAKEMMAGGDPKASFQSMFAAAARRWTNGQHDADYPEPWLAFQSRCIGAFQALLETTGPSQTALVFTSGGPVAAVCQHLMGLSDAQTMAINWKLVNAGVTKLITGKSGVHVSTLNGHQHLESTERKLITYR